MTTVRRLDLTYADPFFIGFDEIVHKLNTKSSFNQNSGGNYPPYNIIRTGETSYVVELAVAGLSTKDIDIVLQDGILTIESNPITQEEPEYLHRGIATRAFKRTFTLADTIEVRGADMVNGMLLVELENIIPEAKKARKIAISSPVDNREFLTEYDEKA